jgi:hypothetical protein
MTDEYTEDFVDQFYDMDPLIEDVLFDGRFVQNGMVILPENPMNRQDLKHMDPGSRNRALLDNRWCRATQVSITGEFLEFIAVYEDGTKRKRTVPVERAWLVKYDSVPEFDEVGPEPIGTAKVNETPEGLNIEYRPANDPGWVKGLEDKWQDEKGTSTQRPRTGTIEESDRNARAYGWEVGRGQELGSIVGMTEDNPFIDPNWRGKVIFEEADPPMDLKYDPKIDGPTTKANCTIPNCKDHDHEDPSYQPDC